MSTRPPWANTGGEPAAHFSSLCYLTVGTGIGAGIIIDGRPVHGLIHPEPGHLRIPHDRTRDPFDGACPVHGDCWEGLAAGGAIAARWGAAAPELSDEHPAWALEAEYLALGILSIVTVVSPQRVIVGGGVMERAGLLQAVREGLRMLVGGYLDTPLLGDRIDEYVVSPGLGDRAGVLGDRLAAGGDRARLRPNSFRSGGIGPITRLMSRSDAFLHRRRMGLGPVSPPAPGARILAAAPHPRQTLGWGLRRHDRWLERWIRIHRGSRPPPVQPPDGRRRHRGDRRSRHPHRRSLADRLRLVQLPRARSRRGDHRGRPGVPGALGDPPELVAAARQPGALRGDRDPADRAARLRGHACFCRRSPISTCR